ncbi:MAG: hypothetical protein SFX73_11745 [Kofleriaceae bacterium]|nr:hypothetical protein [Kofleriaceae bacterium]
MSAKKRAPKKRPFKLSEWLRDLAKRADKGEVYGIKCRVHWAGGWSELDLPRRDPRKPR